MIFHTSDLEMLDLTWLAAVLVVSIMSLSDPIGIWEPSSVLCMEPGLKVRWLLVYGSPNPGGGELQALIL
jgi:hypothetical protein